MKSFKVAGRKIGAGAPLFIIAEAGVNHNGDVGLALKLIDAAKQAGADAVKFQTWVTGKLVVRDAPMAEYQKRNIGVDEGQFEMLKRLELSYDAFRKLKAHADRLDYLFFSTPDEEDSADFLEQLDVPLFKIGSGEVTNIPLLRHVAKKKKPLILSTGMSTLAEVTAAVGAIRDTGNEKFALLHCVSNYPASPDECNLRAMDTMAAAFDCPVGYSDHTLDNVVSIAAAARGACIIERHITLDTAMSGPDHRASLDPGQFAEFVRAIRSTERALGSGVKKPAPSELATKKVVQKAIITARALRKGARILPEDICLRRASGGLPPTELTRVIGRAAARDVEPGRVITPDMLS